MNTPQPSSTAADTPPFPRQGGGASAAAIDAFIARWGSSAGAERANYQIFLAELCDLLGVPRPDPSVADEAANRYVFDKAVTFPLPDGKTTTKYAVRPKTTSAASPTTTRHSCSSSTSAIRSSSTPTSPGWARSTRRFRTPAAIASHSPTCATKPSANGSAPSGSTRSRSIPPAIRRRSPARSPPGSPCSRGDWRRSTMTPRAWPGF